MWKRGHTFPGALIRAGRSTRAYSRRWRSTLRDIRRVRVTERQGSPKRRRRAGYLKLRVHPEEAAAIAAQAHAVGMSVGAYLRAVGAGYEPRAVVDRDQVDAMLRVNGDLGRLGGLLKLW